MSSDLGFPSAMSAMDYSFKVRADYRFQLVRVTGCLPVHCISSLRDSTIGCSYRARAVAIRRTRNKWLKRSVAVHQPTKTPILGNNYLTDDEMIGSLLSALTEGFSLAANYQHIALAHNGSDRSMLGRLRHTGMFKANSCITKPSVWLYLDD